MTTLKQKIHRLYQLVQEIADDDYVDYEAQEQALILIESLM